MYLFESQKYIYVYREKSSVSYQGLVWVRLKPQDCSSKQVFCVGGRAILLSQTRHYGAVLVREDGTSTLTLLDTGFTRCSTRRLFA